MIQRVILVGVASVSFFFQNCGGFKAFSTRLGSGALSSSGAGAVLQPATDKNDANCLTNTAFDACVFAKNPVAAQKSSFTTAMASSTSLDSVQTYGVKLTGLDNSGKLANSTISVVVTRGSAVRVGQTNLRTKARGDTAYTVAQTNAYYWMNRAQEYIQGRTNTFPAAGKGIQVVVDDSLTGWSPTTNSIHLKVDGNGQPMAWSGELALHFFGLANLEYATAGKIRTGLDSRHKTCGLKVYGCCNDATGCGRAIASGVGDYFAAMIFPTSPIVGEAWANQPSGLGFCNVSRSLEDASTKTSANVYSACSASGIAGETSTMGTVYASIWWEIRKAAETANPGFGSIDIDKLFMSHLAKLSGDDNFASAYSKIINLEQSLFNGAYSSILQAKFNGRI